MLSLQLLFLFRVYIAAVDYEPTLLPELIDKSSLIVHGRIEKTDKYTFSLQLNEVLKGDFPVDSVLVCGQFKDWTCAQRFDKYQTGQEALFFLFKGYDPHYKALGGGNEGEMPIVEDSVYYKSQYLRIDKNPVAFKVYGGQISGYRFLTTDFKKAVRYYRENAESLHEKIKRDKLYHLRKINNPVLDRIIDELREKYH
ncbi:MAG: hypothetical protein IPJ82_14305 [Lewinellaceae bacterium]|nr:hypothetical protein [Lewinellaceae bacterium]